MTRNALLIAAATVLLTHVTIAAMRPSFDLDSLALKATHVVVVSEGERIDGVVDVIKSLTGDLRPGARLEFPDLAAFASDWSRTVSTTFGGRGEGDPERVDGSRMILFLVKEQGADGPVFRPAAKWGGMRVSVAWLSNGRAYGFVQVINPGDAVLVRLSQDEGEILEQVVAISRARRDLDAIAALPDPAERARKAAPFTRSGNAWVMFRAFKVLAGAGTGALPVLREMLADEEGLTLHPRMIEALATAGGKAVVPDLVAIVTEETAFWRTTAPDLERGWWNGKGLERKDVQPLRERYSRVLAALRALLKIPDPACRDAVTALRDYWRSLPQLEDKSGLDQMSETCDRVLAGLPGR